jgi:hypothetical protein
MALANVKMMWVVSDATYGKHNKRAKLTAAKKKKKKTREDEGDGLGTRGWRWEGWAEIDM